MSKTLINDAFWRLGCTYSRQLSRYYRYSFLQFGDTHAAVLINVTSQEVVTSFSMGSVDLNNIDTKDDGVISQTESLSSVPREPDGVVSRLNPNIFYIYYFHLIVKTTTTKCIFFWMLQTWIQGGYFATANEGDMIGGSRGFTIFDSGESIQKIKKSRMFYTHLCHLTFTCLFYHMQMEMSFMSLDLLPNILSQVSVTTPMAVQITRVSNSRMSFMLRIFSCC